MLPALKRGLPEAKLPFERPAVAAALVAASAGANVVRRSSLPAIPREAAVVMASLVPALVALRGEELTRYHGAEHISIGTYETGAPAAKEHERCGSHLIGPLTLATALAGAASELPLHATGEGADRRRDRRDGRRGRGVRMDEPASREPPFACSRRPGTELQRRISTREPSPAQLEVAEAAIRACLDAEAAYAT